jgi:hypothetical protein
VTASSLISAFPIMAVGSAKRKGQKGGRRERANLDGLDHLHRMLTRRFDLKKEVCDVVEEEYSRWYRD